MWCLHICQKRLGTLLQNTRQAWPCEVNILQISFDLGALVLHSCDHCSRLEISQESMNMDSVVAQNGPTYRVKNSPVDYSAFSFDLDIVKQT